MSAYRTIVVGTDGSERSMGAVDRAATIAGDAGATLLVVCAYCSPSTWTFPEAAGVLASEEYYVAGARSAEHTLHAATDRAHTRGAGIVKTLAVRGDVAQVLTEIVADRRRPAGGRRSGPRHRRRAAARIGPRPSRPRRGLRRDDRPHQGLKGGHHPGRC